MQCKEFVTELAKAPEKYSPAALAHLDQCVRCSGLLADMEAIRASAAELAEEEPPERIWISLRNQLETEGLIRKAEEPVEVSVPRTSLWLSLRPALAGVYLTVLVLVGGLLAVRMDPVVAPAPGVNTVAGVRVEVPADLIPAAEAETPAEIRERNPVVTASYTQGLEIIDNFILLCEKTVREEPNNDMAREYLYDAYQQKAELLAKSTERGAWGD